MSNEKLRQEVTDRIVNAAYPEQLSEIAESARRAVAADHLILITNVSMEAAGRPGSTDIMTFAVQDESRDADDVYGDLVLSMLRAANGLLRQETQLEVVMRDRRNGELRELPESEFLNRIEV